MRDKIECPSCSGTGLYSGFAEPQGVAVPCSQCKGKGHAMGGNKVFTKKKKAQGIHTVWLNAGLWFMRGQNTGNKITAEEFYNQE